MKPTTIRCIIAIALTTGAVGSQAHADQLADIKARGTLVCGVLSTLDPFGYVDPQSRTLVGYDIDFCNGIAKHLGLKAETRQISLDARIPELTQGRVDLLAAVLSYNEARAQQIDFSHAYYVSYSKMGVPADAGYTTLTQLAGKRISAVKGSSTGALLQVTLPDAKLVNYDDAPSAFMALAQRKVQGFGLTEPMLRRFISKLGPDSKLAVLEQPIGQEKWGLGIKKGEPGLLSAVNGALAAMESSGEAQAIFDHWLGHATLYQMTRDFKVEPIKP